VPPAASPSTASSGAAASARPTVTQSASPAPAASGGTGSAGASAPPLDPSAPVRFAVALFDVNESTIAPGSAATIEALGVAPTSSAAPGTAGPEVARPTTRDELWVPILLLVLLALCVEWAVYHRDALVRLRRSLAARFGRNVTDGSA
jgi:hypothetical protein